MVPFLALVSITAFGADEPVGLGAGLMALFSAIQGKANAAVLVMCAIQILRTNEALGILGKIGLQGNAMRIAVAVLTTLGYVANAWVTSGNLGAAAIEGLFTAGGAMLIFQAFKKESEKSGEVALSAAIQKKSKNLA